MKVLQTSSNWLKIIVILATDCLEIFIWYNSHINVNRKDRIFQKHEEFDLFEPYRGPITLLHLMSSETMARTLQEIKALGTVNPIYNPGIIVSADIRPYPEHSFHKT